MHGFSLANHLIFGIALLLVATAGLGLTKSEEVVSEPSHAGLESYTSADQEQQPKDTKTYPRRLEFSGYDWCAKVQSNPAGPGPNYFSDHVKDLWVDSDGLHLTVSTRDGKWHCTEVILQESFGYGSYIFQTATEPAEIDPNVVAGMFTWEAGLPWPNRELDFEFARWGNLQDDTNAQFVVQPFSKSGNMVRYRVEAEAKVQYLTQVMTWQPGKVRFQTARGRHDTAQIPEAARIISWNYEGDGVPTPGRENVRINLWLNDGKPPASGKPVEFIVKRFLYVPIVE